VSEQGHKTRGALASEIGEQFRRQWETIRGLVDGVPDDQWKTGDVVHLVPARIVYHILGGTEVYARSTTYEEYKAHQKYTLDWQTAPAGELPDRRTTLRNIEAAEKAIGIWLADLDDDGLLTTDEGFPWTGSRKVGRAMYLIRHTQNHIGEANAELRRRGLARGRWG
jgi:hypothetical protein